MYYVTVIALSHHVSVVMCFIHIIIIIITGDTRETSFLFQRLSMLIQRFNSALITDSFCFADEDPDL